jgi:TonB family protein
MRNGLWLLPVLAIGPLTWAADGRVSEPSEKGSRVGYVDCSSRGEGNIVPTYFDVCERVPFAGLACGRKLTVLEKHGPWLKVAVTNESPRYISSTLVSQRADTFVPFDADSGIADLGPGSCPATTEHQHPAPHAIYAPDPEYSDEARKNRISGTVVLSMTVGTDGLPHDIRVEKKLGYGLDEKALEAMRKWRFQPAVRDGQPFEAHINVSMSFRLFQ